MIGVIGGSGLDEMQELQIIRQEKIQTPYGQCSSDIITGLLEGKEIAFLPRHGNKHSIPPHKINYRANIHALKSIGIMEVIAVAAVGSITGLSDCGLMIPDQIIDYTFGREHTFFDGVESPVTHVDFTQPYCEALRSKLIAASNNLDTEVRAYGTYGATQGPRFETIAEINRMEKDGVDIVGMTGMPEASLAREAGLCYATIAVSVNAAAGKASGEISLEEIEMNLKTGMEHVKQLIRLAIA